MALNRKNAAGLRLLVLASYIAWAAPSPARVFSRWKAAAQPSRALELGGGATAYRAPVEVNGVRADLEILHFHEPVDRLRRRISRLAPVTEAPAGRAPASLTAFERAGRSYRLLAVPSANPDESLLFLIDAPAAQHASRPACTLSHDIPAPPGSEPLFTARDRRTGFDLWLSSTPARPADIRAFFDAALPARGWQPLPAAGRPAPLGDCAVFLREDALCLVYVHADAAGESRIVILRKAQSIP